MAKKPKRPKASAPLTSWKKYDQRLADWEKAKREKERLIKKHRG